MVKKCVECMPNGLFVSYGNFPECVNDTSAWGIVKKKKKKKKNFNYGMTWVLVGICLLCNYVIETI